MPPRYGTVQATCIGQSQALMFVNGGGETVEDIDFLSTLTGFEVLRDELARLMPGVAIRRSSKYASGTPVFNEMFDGGTGTLSGNPAFWSIGGNTYAQHGIDACAALLSGATQAGLCVMVHYWHGQDLSSHFWTEAAWRDAMMAFYARLHADVAPAWGEFRILPVLTSSRPNERDGALIKARRIWKTWAGIDDYPGAGRIPYVLPPIESTGISARGGYIAGSGDFTHITRGSAWRGALLIAARIAGLNGFNPAVPDAPRLARAVRTGPATLTAWVSLPAKRKLTVQYDGGFRVSTHQNDCTVSFVDNADAARGWARVGLTAPSTIQANDRLTYKTGAGFAYWENGTTAPRGRLLVNFEDTTASGNLVITDGCEDLRETTPPVFTMRHEDRGVAIEGI